MFGNRRYWLLPMLALLLVLLSSGGTTHTAQAGGPWSAWLYNSLTGALVHVYPDGLPAESTLFPLPPGTSNYPSSIAISRDGTRMAACLTDDSGLTSMHVYDTVISSYIAAWLPSGPIMDCWLGGYSFSEDGNQVAFGVLNHWPGDVADTRPDWEVFVVEMNTSAVIYYLNSSMPSVTALGITTSGMMPMLQYFDSSIIAFALVPWGTEGPDTVSSIFWSLSTNSVLLGSGGYEHMGLDLLPGSGEAIWPEYNPSLPTGALEGPGLPANVIMYSNKTGAKYPIFHNGAVIFSPTLVDQGRRVAFMVYDAVSGLQDWMFLDRYGANGWLPIDPEVYQVWGTYDGYVYLIQSGDAPQVVYDRFNGSAIETYTAWTGTAGTYWQIIWVSPMSSAAGLSPFPQTAVLGPPPLPTLSPPVINTPFPTLPPPVMVTPTVVPGTLAVGGHALAHTTAGDMLRVRSGPGFSSSVVFQLVNGTRVTLLEGPTGGDGYWWWRI